MRLADADVLPFDVETLVETIAEYAEQLETLTEQMREQTAEKNLLIREGAYVAAADPKRTYVPPQPDEPVPHLNFSPLENAAGVLERQHPRAYLEAVAKGDGDSLRPEQADALNTVLMSIEQSLGRDEGLPGRPWYRHYLYAPGFYTGYGVKTLPAVREAIELRRWREAGEQIEITAAVLGQLNRKIERATEIVERQVALCADLPVPFLLYRFAEDTAIRRKRVHRCVRGNCGPAALVIVCSLLPAPLLAQVTNGSFEDSPNHLNGWTVGPSARVEALQASNFGPNSLPVPDGSWYALLSTGPGDVRGRPRRRLRRERHRRLRQRDARHDLHDDGGQRVVETPVGIPDRRDRPRRPGFSAVRRPVRHHDRRKLHRQR